MKPHAWGEKGASAERENVSVIAHVAERKEQIFAQVEADTIDQSRRVVVAVADSEHVDKPKEVVAQPKEKEVKKKPDKESISAAAEVFMASAFIGILGLVGLAGIGQLIFLPFIVGRLYRDIDRLGIMNPLGRFAFWLGKISALLKAVQLGAPLLLVMFPVLATVGATFMTFALFALMIGSYQLGRQTKPELELSKLLPSTEGVWRWIVGKKKKASESNTRSEPTA